MREGRLTESQLENLQALERPIVYTDGIEGTLLQVPSTNSIICGKFLTPRLEQFSAQEGRGAMQQQEIGRNP